MKKLLLFTTVLMFGFITGFSQNLSLVFQGNPIGPNQVIVEEGAANGNMMVFEVQVTNNSSSSMDVLAKKVENYLADGTTNSFCWGGLCYPPNVYISPNASTIPAGGTTAPGEFSGDYYPGTIPGESSISYVFFDSSNPNDSVMVTVIYTTITGIALNVNKDFDLSTPYPNPANQFVKFDYNLKEYQNASIRIYSLVGALVSEISINEPSGTIALPTDKFQEGFYFYRLSSSSKELKTGRFVVSH